MVPKLRGDACEGLARRIHRNGLSNLDPSEGTTTARGILPFQHNGYRFAVDAESVSELKDGLAGLLAAARKPPV
jgi:hypothetical protein